MSARAARRAGRRVLPPGPAVRTAAAATVILAVAYAAGAIVFNLLAGAHLIGQHDAQLADRISDARRDPSQVARPAGDSGGYDADADSVPVYLWAAGSGGTATAHSPGAPPLPGSLFRPGAARDGRPETVGLGSAGTLFRVSVVRDGGGWLAAAQSQSADAHTLDLLRKAELAGAPFVLTAMFLGLLAVGRRALAPVEQSRRRQLEFTADASHELRTPLAVIQAETGVALSAPRDADGYRDALARVEAETGRLRRLVDDMLWLSRFDSRPPRPGDEPVDLGILARACADRFRAVGPALTADTPEAPVLISAPPDWIDRLVGVLIDNACRYAGPEGQVGIRVVPEGNRVSLFVEDSGPGIPAAERPRLFDRFYRAAAHGSGSGLGLAIADSIVRSTGGRWQVGDSGLGGAMMSVSWRNAQHQPARHHAV
jgi:signal transduction histidine kinase